MIERPRWISKPISTYHPLLYHLAQGVRRMERRVEWLLDGRTYAHKKLPQPLPHRLKKHQSVLIRKTGSPRADQLQVNKVDNLKIVRGILDGLVIRPGESFSFCKLVGRPSIRRGFKPGMELSGGVARAGIGGGICQVSNLIYWLALHSPLQVVERHHHSFDPFPDNKRVLPFASGATVMFNYKDLRLKNTTAHDFQLRFWLDHKCFNGELRCSALWPYSYNVYQKDHRFERVQGRYYRSNQLWRKVVRKDTGQTVGHQYLCSNHARVKYQPRPQELAL